LNQSWNGFTAAITQNFSNITLPEGDYIWNVWCNDTTNNANFSAANYTFRIDNTGPGVNLQNPVDYENSTTASVTFTYQVSDPSSISTCSLYINQTLNSSSSSISKDTNQTFTATLFNDEYEWYVNCTDSAGNTNNSETRYLTQTCTESWSCGSWSACSGGTQTRTCTDANNCLAQANKPLESQSCSDGGSTGGGGGGSSGGTSGASGGVSETVSLATGGGAGETKTVEFSKDVAVTELAITFQNEVSQASITVEKLTSKPTETTTPSGTTYYYLKIDKSLKDEDIKDAKLKFKVEKTWLTSKGFLAEEVVLKRFVKSWETLPTKQLKKDANYVYYEAQTSGFSYFAITAEKKPVPKVEPVEEKEEPTPQAPVEKPAEQITTPQPKNWWTKLGMLWIIIGILALIGLGMGGYRLSGTTIRKMLQAGSSRNEEQQRTPPKT